MVRQLTTLLGAVIAALLLTQSVIAGELTLQSVEKRLNSFKTSGDHRFAPATTNRAEAYFGAAMLANDGQKPEESAAAIEKADALLIEAQTTAKGFKTQFADLLKLRADTQDVFKVIATDNQHGAFQANAEFDAAEAKLDAVIKSREQGELNQLQGLAESARKAYAYAMSLGLPLLSDLAATQISGAAAKGAKNYAPLTYEAAKKKFASLRGYIDGLDATPPKSPTDAFYLGLEAKMLTDQVRAWRRARGSHEKRTLDERKFRKALADALEMESSDNIYLINIPEQEIVSKVTALHQALAAERKGRAEDEQRLKLEFQAELEAQIAARSDELMAAQRDQLTEMKEAFRAKLERETAEKKRQQRVRETFKKGDADIFFNLDGSLLLRMTSLVFPSGRSAIGKKQQPLLDRLKAALDVYGDRKVRIEGHTDNVGDVRPNQVLSLKRAEAVRDYLIKAGTAAGRLKALGYGEVRPIASNEFEQGRAMNRRIDIIIEAAQ